MKKESLNTPHRRNPHIEYSSNANDILRQCGNKLESADSPIIRNDSFSEQSNHCLVNNLAKQPKNIQDNHTGSSLALSKKQCLSLSQFNRMPKQINIYGPSRTFLKEENKEFLKKLITRMKVNNLVRRFVLNISRDVKSSSAIDQFQRIDELKSVYFKSSELTFLKQYLFFFLYMCSLFSFGFLFFYSTILIAYPQLEQYQSAIFIKLFAVVLISSKLIQKINTPKPISTKYMLLPVKNHTILQNFIQHFAIYLMILIAYVCSIWNHSSLNKIIQSFIVLKMYQQLKSFQKNSLVSFRQIIINCRLWRILNILLLNIIVLHFIAVGLSLFQKNDAVNLFQAEGVDLIWSKKYLYSFFQAIKIMFTFGISNIPITSSFDVVVLILIQIVSLLTLGVSFYLLRQILVQKQNQNLIEELKVNLKSVDAPQQFKQLMHNYIALKCSDQYGQFKKEQQLVNSFDDDLRDTVKRKMNSNLLRDNFLAQGFFKTLTSSLGLFQNKICYHQQIIKVFNPNPEIIFLLTGSVRIKSSQFCSSFSSLYAEDANFSRFSADIHLLSSSFLTNQRKRYTISSNQISRLAVIKYDQFLSKLRQHRREHERFMYYRDSSTKHQEHEVFSCVLCRYNHTKLQCPKLHMFIRKQLCITKHLHNIKARKNIRIQQKVIKVVPQNCLTLYRHHNKVYTHNIWKCQVHKQHKYVQAESPQEQIELDQLCNFTQYFADFNFNNIQHKLKA